MSRRGAYFTLRSYVLSAKIRQMLSGKANIKLGFFGKEAGLN